MVGAAWRGVSLVGDPAAGSPGLTMVSSGIKAKRR